MLPAVHVPHSEMRQVPYPPVSRVLGRVGTSAPPMLAARRGAPTRGAGCEQCRVWSNAIYLKPLLFTKTLCPRGRAVQGTPAPIAPEKLDTLEFPL